MLVLTRKSREAVVVGHPGLLEQMLKVTVLEIVGSRVRLGFDVAENIAVHRSEVWEQICANGPPESDDSPKENR
jgi:carbon storage regulator CsrA